MGDVNVVAVGGRLIRDPDTHVAQRSYGESTVCNFRIVSRQSKTSRPVYIDIVVWGNNAEAASAHLKEGSSVVVEGKLILYKRKRQDGGEDHQVRVLANYIHYGENCDPDPDSDWARDNEYEDDDEQEEETEDTT